MNMDQLRVAVNVVVVLATLTAITFPVMYAFSTWNRSFIGRFLMADSIAYALLMSLTTFFRFWQPMDPQMVRTIYLIAFVGILITNVALLYGLWCVNFHPKRKEDPHGGLSGPARRTPMVGYQGQHAMPDDNVSVEETTRPFWMSDAIYNFLKWMAQIVLPAAATFYLTIGDLWDLPNPDKVSGTIVAFDTFLGVVLLITNKAYNNSPSKYDGVIDVKDIEDGPKVYKLLVNTAVDEIDQKEQLVLKVNKPEV